MSLQIDNLWEALEIGKFPDPKLFIGKHVIGLHSGKAYHVTGIGECDSQACEGVFLVDTGGLVHFSNVDWYATLSPTPPAQEKEA